MIFLLIIFILVIWLLIISKFSKQKDNTKIHLLKKMILGVIYFFIFFIAYYFLIAFIAMIPLAFLSRNADTDTGLWAYAIILGMALSPILSIISTSKTLKKKLK